MKVTWNDKKYRLTGWRNALAWAFVAIPAGLAIIIATLTLAILGPAMALLLWGQKPVEKDEEASPCQTIT
jgi:zinc transporter ZupT